MMLQNKNSPSWSSHLSRKTYWQSFPGLLAKSGLVGGQQSASNAKIAVLATIGYQGVVLLQVSKVFPRSGGNFGG